MYVPLSAMVFYAHEPGGDSGFKMAGLVIYKPFPYVSFKHDLFSIVQLLRCSRSCFKYGSERKTLIIHPNAKTFFLNIFATSLRELYEMK